MALGSLVLGAAPPKRRMPAWFVAHGAPTQALTPDGALGKALQAAARSLPPLEAVVSISAHWETSGVRITAGETAPIVHDFGGFPEALYQVQYPADGWPALAAELAENVAAQNLPVLLDPKRPLDHGTWVPLLLAFGPRRLKVVQVSLPVPRDPLSLVKLGQALGPLRDRGVLLMGSGGLIHNLRRLAWQGGPPEGWAKKFDEHLEAALPSRDPDSVARLRRLPEFALAAPSTEHFDPVYAVLGAAQGDDRLTWMLKDWELGSLSLRSFVLG